MSSDTKRAENQDSGERSNDTSEKESNTMQSRDADFSALEGDEKGAERKQEARSAADESASEVEKLRSELQEHKDKYLRALAEIENVKKRAVKERSEMLKYQGERIIVDLLDVLDNLELALKHSEADPQKLKAGVEMIYKQFVDTLGRWEVRADSALGKEFDPTRFEALSKVPVSDAAPGTVINEFKKAYLYKDKLIRVGSVVVAGEKGSEEGSQEGQEAK